MTGPAGRWWLSINTGLQMTPGEMTEDEAVALANTISAKVGDHLRQMGIHDGGEPLHVVACRAAAEAKLWLAEHWRHRTRDYGVTCLHLVFHSGPDRTGDLLAEADGVDGSYLLHAEAAA